MEAQDPKKNTMEENTLQAEQPATPSTEEKMMPSAEESTFSETAQAEKIREEASPSNEDEGTAAPTEEPAEEPLTEKHAASEEALPDAATEENTAEDAASETAPEREEHARTQPGEQTDAIPDTQEPVPGNTGEHTVPNPNDLPLDVPSFMTVPLPRLSPETAAALARKKKTAAFTPPTPPPAEPETPPTVPRFDPLPKPLPSKRKYYKELKQQKQRKMMAIWLPIALLTVLVLLWGVWRMVAPGENGKGYPPYTIAIDPGHGGDDTGAIGFYTESQVTWATAQQLYALLDADSRFRPLLTKTETESLKPSERARVANKKNADLLLSIHCNSASADVVGFECYPPPPGWKYNEESLEFAGLLGQEMSALGATLRGTDGVRYLYYVNGEKTLRELGSDPLDGASTFSVLENTGCPAVLVEQCFLTNQGDAEAFAGQTGRQRSARAYYRAICAYFGLEPMAES